MKEIKPTDVACINCKFGVHEPQSNQVMCHLNPPNQVLMQIPNSKKVLAPGEATHVLVSQALPATIAPDWWCSHFTNKAAAVVLK